MQTFLPYPDFEASAAVLDRLRLGKQRVETFQLLNAIRGVDKNGEPVSGVRGWTNHPAAVMWRRYTPALALYGVAMCDEWIRRGYNDTMRERLYAIYESEMETGHLILPYWFGDPAFHRSHQSNLLRKDREFYAGQFSGVPDDLPYIWFPESPSLHLTSVR